MYRMPDRLFSYEIFALETERLRLSVLKKSCAGMVTDYLKRNRGFHQRFSQTHNASYFTYQTQKKYLKFDAEDFKKGRIFPFWITLKDDPSKIIGRVSYFNVALGGMMSCSIGYHLDKDHLSMGYMTEAITEADAFLFDEMKFHRIEAFILPENERSLKLIKKLGYRYEGTRISYMHINGEWRDHEAFFKLNKNN